jgi:hypothetical protein
MIPYKRRSNIRWNWLGRIGNEPYLIINAVFAGVILLIIAYSVIFSPDKNNYPIICIHERLTGEPCFSCGLSHSISLIIRCRIDEAFKLNIYGMRVFLFFFLQLILRVFFSLFYMKSQETRKQLIILDIAGSALIFTISFWPFIANIISGLFP